MKENYGTLSETIGGLKKDGYTLDFNVQEDRMVCHQINAVLSPEYFVIDKVYRFEGSSNPDDQSVLYAISSSKFDVKGLLVNGYGISADPATDAIIAKLKTHHEESTTKIFIKNEAMKDKSNEATTLRPEGDRILNASLVEIDLNKFIVELKQEITWAESDRNSITVFKSDYMTIVLIGLHAQAELKEHSAKGIINVQVLEGEIDFTADHKTVSIGKGQMISLHKTIPHSVLAVKESFFLLTMV